MHTHTHAHRDIIILPMHTPTGIILIPMHTRGHTHNDIYCTNINIGYWIFWRYGSLVCMSISMIPVCVGMSIHSLSEGHNFLHCQHFWVQCWYGLASNSRLGTAYLKLQRLIFVIDYTHHRIEALYIIIDLQCRSCISFQWIIKWKHRGCWCLGGGAKAT